jgi:hypothetical protein
MRFRNSEASKRFAARREREDSAQRLHDVAPTLTRLDLELAESRAGMTDPHSVYVRRVVVAQAPAHFEIACGDSACQDGGHDMTADVLDALRRRQETFTAEDACRGTIGSVGSPCERVLKLSGTAKYE